MATYWGDLVKRNPSTGQKGQATIEAVLIMTALMAVLTLTVNLIREKNVLAELVERPWSMLGGMIENGVWEPRETGAARHPNHFSRHASPLGDTL